MPPLQITIDISPALADVATRQALIERMRWSEWITREASRLLADRAELVCWPTARDRNE